MERIGFQYMDLVNELSKSVHGNYYEYQDTTLKAARTDPEFLGHFIAWNLLKGEIRDSKISIPVFSLRGLSDHVYVENSIASLMTLDPVNLVKAYRLNKELSAKGQTISGGKSLHFREMLQNAIQEYLTVRENNRKWWERTVLQHRSAMKELYAVSHTVPSVFAQAILFDRKYPRGSVFEKIARLRTMPAKEAAGVILNERIPYQTAIGALGMSKEVYKKHPEFALAFMEQMTGQQLLISTKFLKSLGVFDSAMLKSEYDKALARASRDKKVSTLKADKVASVLEGSVEESVIKKLSAVQEEKIEQTGGIEGDWLILGDKSGSMSEAISTAIDISALLARAVKGKVYLCFFDVHPRFFDVTGKTLQEIKQMCRGITANGGTACGVGLDYIMSKGIAVNGIVLVSDGGDNTYPFFSEMYEQYIKRMNVMPSVTFIKLSGEGDRVTRGMQDRHFPMITFDLRKKSVDYYSLPNIIKTLKVGSFALLDEIMGTQLLTLQKVFSAVK